MNKAANWSKKFSIMIVLGFRIANLILHTAALGLSIWQFSITRSKIYRKLIFATASLIVSDIFLTNFFTSKFHTGFLTIIAYMPLYLSLLLYAILPVQLLQFWLHTVRNSSMSSMNFMVYMNVLYITHPILFIVAIILIIIYLITGLYKLGVMYAVGAVYSVACLFAAYMVWMCNRDLTINAIQQRQLWRMAGMTVVISPTFLMSLSDPGLYVLFVLTWIYLAIALWPLKYWSTMNNGLLLHSEQQGRIVQGSLSPPVVISVQQEN
jgi:hypothetical protein